MGEHDAADEEESQAGSGLLFVPVGTPVRVLVEHVVAVLPGIPGPSSITSIVAPALSIRAFTWIGASCGENFAALSTNWRTTSMIHFRSSATSSFVTSSSTGCPPTSAEAIPSRTVAPSPCGRMS
jgi:hypothetical protein